MSFLLGPNGKLLLVGGKPLSFTAGAPASGGNTVPTLVQWYMVSETGYTSRFNIQPNAASGNTAANVPILFSYTGSDPVKVEARVVDSLNGNAQVVPWTDVTNSAPPANPGTYLTYLNNVPVWIGLKRQIRINGNAALMDLDASPFNIGPHIFFEGQSNGTGTLSPGSASSATIPGTSTTELSFFNSNGTGAMFCYGFTRVGNNNASYWSYGLNYSGGPTLLRLAGNQLAAKHNRKVGVAITPYVQNATPLSGFMNLTTGVMSLLVNNGTSGTAIGFSSPPNIVMGDYQMVLLHQGETAATGETTRGARSGNLIKLCQAHIDQVGKFGRLPNQITFLFAMMGVCAPKSTGAVESPHMEVLRAAVMDLIEYSKTVAWTSNGVSGVGWDVRIGWNCIDLDPATAGDTAGLHFGGTDKKRSLLRAAQSILHTIDPVNVPISGKGPSLTGTNTRSGDDITLTISHDGGTGLAARTPGSPITGWYANTAADFSGTDIPLTNVTIVDATHVRVTAIGAPATFYIKHCGGRFVGSFSLRSHYPEVSNLIYDNFAYPSTAAPAEQFTEGLPLLPTPDAIKVGP